MFISIEQQRSLQNSYLLSRCCARSVGLDICLYMICVRPCHIDVTWLRCKNMIRCYLLHDTSNDIYDCSGQMNCSFTEKLQRFLHINTNYHNAFIEQHHTIWRYVLHPCIFHKILFATKAFFSI